MTSIWMVALGSALGGVARYTIGMWILRSYGSWLPWGTLLVNVAGCLVIGLVASMTKSQPMRALLMAGFCGGFTTFSSFSLETLNLLENGQAARALLYVAASVCVCLAAVWAGLMIGREWSPGR